MIKTKLLWMMTGLSVVSYAVYPALGMDPLENVAPADQEAAEVSYFSPFIQDLINELLSRPIESLGQQESELLDAVKRVSQQITLLMGQDSAESKEPSREAVQEKIDTIAQQQFNGPIDRMPNEIIAAILVQLSPKELLVASGVNKKWKAIAADVMASNLIKNGARLDQSFLKENIGPLYKLFMLRVPPKYLNMSFVEKISLNPEKNFVGAMAGLSTVIVLRSNDPKIPVGSSLKLVKPKIPLMKEVNIHDPRYAAQSAENQQRRKKLDPHNLRSLSLGDIIYFDDIDSGNLTINPTGLMVEKRDPADKVAR